MSERDRAQGDVTVAREQVRQAQEEASRLRTELEQARAEVAKAQELARAQEAGTADRAQLGAEIARLQDEAKKAAEKIDFLEARLREADYSKTEAGHIARSSDEARRKYEARLEEAEQKIAAETKRAAEFAARVKELEAVAAKGSEDLEKRASEAERERGQAIARATELEARTKGYESRIKELEQQLVATPAAPADAGSLSDKVQRLEREKAEILLESKREIERLSREQEALREELESAGEMIERLGKELELT